MGTTPARDHSSHGTGPNPREATYDIFSDWYSSLDRRFLDTRSSAYMQRRWLRSPATRWDYNITRRTILEELQPGPDDRVLEIGCGPGTWTREVAQLCREVVAVDISESMIQSAQIYTEGLPVSFVHSDFLKSRLQGKFDKVFSARAIEYMEDWDLLARKIARLLRPGGTAVLVTKTRLSIWRGRTRLVYGRWPFGWLRKLGIAPEARPREVPRQYVHSPGQLVRYFAPHRLGLVNIRPVVVRLPIFKDGFHELPIAPRWLEGPLLRSFSALYEASLGTPRSLLFVPMLLSESYCATLRYMPGAGSREVADDRARQVTVGPQ